jgi:hypothetical protein
MNLCGEAALLRMPDDEYSNFEAAFHVVWRGMVMDEQALVRTTLSSRLVLARSGGYHRPIELT